MCSDKEETSLRQKTAGLGKRHFIFSVSGKFFFFRFEQLQQLQENFFSGNPPGKLTEFEVEKEEKIFQNLNLLKS